MIILPSNTFWAMVGIALALDAAAYATGWRWLTIVAALMFAGAFIVQDVRSQRSNHD